MGGNSPSHLHHGDGVGGGVTLVEGIRLSDRVIKRMRQKPVCPLPHTDSTTPKPTPVPTPSVEHQLPPLTPPPDFIPAPPQEAPSAPGLPPGNLSPTSRVTFHSPLPATPPEPATLPPPPIEPVPPPVELVPTPPAVPDTPPSSVASIPPPPTKPTTVPPPPPVEPARPAQHGPPQPVDLAPASLAVPETPPPSPPAESTTPVKSVLLPPVPPPPSPGCPSADLAVAVPTREGPDDRFPPPEEPAAAAAPPTFPEAEEEVGASLSGAPPAAASLIAPANFEKELRQKMKEGLERRLQEEMARRRQELQLLLEAAQAQTRAAAKSWAEAEVAERVKAALEADKAANEAGFSQAVAEERRRTEDDRLVIQLYRMEMKAQQLEEKEEALKKRNALYKEHIFKLEAKCSDFYKATAASFQKGKEDTQRRFARVTIQPVCGDLQSQVLKCYREQAGKSLSCSRIASAYMQCVQQARKNQPSTAG